MSDRRVLTAAQDEGFSHLSIDLSVARADEVFKSGPFSGLIVLNFGGIPNATIRFNSQAAPPIPLLRGFQYDSQSGSFQRFFLSNDALAGETLDIILIRDPDVSIRLGGTAGLVNVGAGGLAFGVGADNADSVAASALLDKQVVMARSQLFNGLTWDREMGNTEVVALPSAVRPALADSPVQDNPNGHSIQIFLDVTFNPGGAETLRALLLAVDPVSGGATGLAKTLTSTFGGVPGKAILAVGPGVTDLTGLSGSTGGNATAINAPKTFIIRVQPSAAGAWEYSVAYSLLG